MSTHLRVKYRGYDPERDRIAEAIADRHGCTGSGGGFDYRTGERDLEFALPEPTGAAIAELKASGFNVAMRLHIVAALAKLTGKNT